MGGHIVKGFGDDGVKHRVGACDRLGTTDRAELELVAGEGKRAGAVAVTGILGQLG